ncbi:MAG: tRNA (adenosine(37)-N6)-dimethylallyltransferase MiaA [Rhodobacteraceae bacterium]|nr:MAG: tRNA (adenosine(37)-N6)-dimethylallyltransferase MiaA [Paracoccaceae bacterium]
MSSSLSSPPEGAAARPILIAGPTASGKSGLALALAERLGGAVINADALQVYAGWRVLTARPAAEEEARAPHRLYGFLPLDAPYSVGRWLRAVEGVLAECAAEGLRPIIVGGTGLYFRALTEGLTPIPEPTPEIRAAAEARLAALGVAGFAAEIAARDPETSARLDCANPRRLLRAWEALEQTGEGLAAWHARTPPPPLPLDRTVPLLLSPDRATLYARCDARFDAMLAGGALDEARAVAALGLPETAPGLKAVGGRELIAHVRGDSSLAEAADAAKAATRNYAKRQITWFRKRMIAWQALSAKESSENLAAATLYAGERP